MQTIFRTLLFLSACCYALPVRAQVLGQGYPPQVATTATVLATDSSTIKGRGTVSSRTLTATSPQVCISGKPSSVTIASGKTGVMRVDISNSKKGQARVTWDFETGFSAQVFNNSAFEVVLANGSSSPEVVVAVSATLVTSKKGLAAITPTTIGYTNIPVNAKSSPAGTSVAFDFRTASKRWFDDSATVIRSLTLELSTPMTCSSSIVVRLAHLKPRDTAKSIDRVSLNTGRSSPRAGDEGLPTPQATPLSDPCNDPDVIAEMKKLDSAWNQLASGCSESKTRCSALEGSGYVLSSEPKNKPEGEECSNNKCDGAPGVCDEWGMCIPPQFKNYENPFFGVHGASISTKRSSDYGSLEWSCFDKKAIEESRQICTMQPKELEAAILSSMLVGKRCKLPDGSNKGVCSNEGLCVPDPSSCESKSNCDVCGDPAEKKICWNNSCVTKEEAKFQLCQTTSPLGGGQGICLPCFAMINRNSDGVCGSSVIAVKPGDPRGMSMEGSPCWRPVMRNNEQRGVKGICKNNTCVLNSLQSTPRPTGTPR